MSEIKTDKLTGVGTAGSIVVTGEGNSTTTNLQQGLAKHWIRHFQGSSVTASTNNASLTDGGSGTYTANLTNSFSTSNACIVCTAGGTDSAGGVSTYESSEVVTSSGMGHNVRDGTESTNSVRKDADQVCVTSYGDLA